MRRIIQNTFWALTVVATMAAAAGADGRDGLVAGSGKVEPITDQVQVTAPVPGKVKFVRVAEGAIVRKGQLLAILEFDESLAQSAALNANLEKALDKVRDAQTPAAKKAAEADLAQARALFDDSRFDWENHFVRAPINGIVRHTAKVGEAVTDGPVVMMADPSVLRVRVDLAGLDASKLHVGQGAYVTAAEFPGKRFPGKVIAIGMAKPLIELEPGASLPLGSKVEAFVVGK